MHISNLLYFNTFLNLILFFFLSSNLSANECTNFEKSIKNAKKSFSLYEQIELNYSLRTAFIDNYNKFSKDDSNVKATRVVLFMLLDQNVWYVFASNNDCLVFWIDLEPDRFIEMIDGGTISKGQGKWRKE